MHSSAPDAWLDSPFRAKGVLYLGTQAFFAAQSPRGVAAVADELPEGRLRSFITQRFLPGGQYEVMVVPALIAAEARALRMTHDRYLLHRTRWQVKEDIGGVYRWLLKLTSPETVIARLPKMITQMFNFGEAFVENRAGQSADFGVNHVPEPLVPWLTVAFKVYVEAAVTMSGAKRCTFVPTASQRLAPQGGFAMVTLRAHVDWT